MEELNEKGIVFQSKGAWRHARRKRRIARQVYKAWHWREIDWDYYDHLHQFSQNKIHCSCPMCSTKTRNKGRRDRKNYAPSINYKASDLRKVITMDQDALEAFGIKHPKRQSKRL